ncbi:MAG: hypothetical protein R3C62_07710 [Chloroflexota bacterium]
MSKLRWLLLALLLLGCGGGGKTAVFSPPLIVPTPTPWATPLVIIATIPTSRTPGPTATTAPPTAVLPSKTPTVRPTVTPTPDTTADLRLATLDDDPVCQWLTKALAATITEETGLRLSSRSFATADALFADLAASTAGSSDLTLCFQDPAHRSFLQTYLGFIDFVGSGYWTNGEDRRLVVGKTAVLHPLQTNHPCAYNLLQALKLGTAPLAPSQDPTLWRNQNQSRLQSWLNCRGD